jgi:hypothetical protein
VKGSIVNDVVANWHDASIMLNDTQAPEVGGLVGVGDETVAWAVVGDDRGVDDAAVPVPVVTPVPATTSPIDWQRSVGSASPPTEV